MDAEWMPIEGAVEVVRGATDDGLRWQLQAGGGPDNFLTVLQVVHPDGQRQGGGLAGPLIPTGHEVITSTSVDDFGPLRFLGRSSPTVELLEVQFADEAPDLHVPVTADMPDAGVRFFVALLPRERRILRVVALDAGGRRVDEWNGLFATARDVSREAQPRRADDAGQPGVPTAGWRPAAPDEIP